MLVKSPQKFSGLRLHLTFNTNLTWRYTHMRDTLINLVGIHKNYGDTTVLKDFNLSIEKNEFLTLLGPSGCGKTTTLRIIAGFEHPEEGIVEFEGQDITSLPPNKRALNTVFQRYALFPHLNVKDNIGFGLKIKGLSKEVINQKVKDILGTVNLAGFENRSIHQLSGGQQQRVAIARALINKPSVLLLDEPLGALDLKMRQDMQHELKKMQRQLGITFVYVTHDQEEALTMSDAIVVMKDGIIQQIGSPENIYNKPVNAFVADFIGESNLLTGVIKTNRLIEVESIQLAYDQTTLAGDELVDVVIRPEDIHIVPKEESSLRGFVDTVIFKGVHYEICVKTDTYTWKIHSTKAANPGEEIGISIPPTNIHIMKKVVG